MGRHRTNVLLTTGLVFLLSWCLALVGCGGDEGSRQTSGGGQTAQAPRTSQVPAQMQMQSPEMPKSEWIKIFDASGFDAWRMDKEGGWVVDGDAMTIAEGGSIWTKERFGDFRLDFQFKVSPDCNSGVFFRTGDLSDPVQTGIEMQILDSAGKENPDKHDCGALYDLVAPSANHMRPAGEWNRGIIICKDSNVKVDLNGYTVVDVDLDDWTTPHKNPDGTDNKFNTALKDFPREGHIGFQDHGHPVWFRSVRVKKL